MLTRIPRGLVSFFQCSLSFPLSASFTNDAPLVPNWAMGKYFVMGCYWFVSILVCITHIIGILGENMPHQRQHFSVMCCDRAIVLENDAERKKYLLCHYQCCCFIMRENSHVIFGKIFFLVKNRVLLFVCSSTFLENLFEQWFHFNSWSDDN